MSSIYSGSSQVLIGFRSNQECRAKYIIIMENTPNPYPLFGTSVPHKVQQHQADEHRSQPDKTDLAVAHFGKPAESFPPQARHEERQDAFDNQHQSECGKQGIHDSPVGLVAILRATGARGGNRKAGRYLPALPPDLRYLKNSELGSSTS